MTSRPPSSGSDVIRDFVPASPHVRHLGIRLESVGDGTARLSLPFRDEIVTIGAVVHGGAIATLIDTAAMAAAWAGAPIPERLRGATVSLSVIYLAPADGQDVVAHAEVLRRGRRLANVRVDVFGTDATHVASAIVAYQLG